MEQIFSKRITELRKQMGITQKQAAAKLQVSQALLSHYENGIRECGLDFLIRAAKFYGVTADYLLGIENERTSVPSSGEIESSHQKQIIADSFDIIIDMANDCENPSAQSDIHHFIMLAIYRMFRQLCLVDETEARKLFAIPPITARAMADASMQMTEVSVGYSLHGHDIARDGFKITDMPYTFTKQQLADKYGEGFDHLMELIRTTEKRMNS